MASERRSGLIARPPTFRKMKPPRNHLRPRQKPAVVKKERRVLGGHTNGVEAIAVSPDGQLVVTGAWGGTLSAEQAAAAATSAPHPSHFAAR